LSFKFGSKNSLKQLRETISGINKNRLEAAENNANISRPAAEVAFFMRCWAMRQPLGDQQLMQSVPISYSMFE